MQERFVRPGYFSYFEVLSQWVFLTVGFSRRACGPTPSKILRSPPPPPPPHSKCCNMVYGVVWQSVFVCSVIFYCWCVAAVHNEAKPMLRDGCLEGGAIRGGMWEGGAIILGGTTNVPY